VNEMPNFAGVMGSPPFRLVCCAFEAATPPAASNRSELSARARSVDSRRIGTLSVMRGVPVA